MACPGRSPCAVATLRAISHASAPSTYTSTRPRRFADRSTAVSTAVMIML
jgi:hypothetical protein